MGLEFGEKSRSWELWRGPDRAGLGVVEAMRVKGLGDGGSLQNYPQMIYYFLKLFILESVRTREH